MDKNPWMDFCDPSDMLPLQYLEAYLSVYIPNSDLIVRVKILLTQLQEKHAKDSQAKDEEDSDLERHILRSTDWMCVNQQGKEPLWSQKQLVHQSWRAQKPPEVSVMHETFQPNVTAAVQTADMIAAVEPVSQFVCRYNVSFSHLLLATLGLPIKIMALSPLVINLSLSCLWAAVPAPHDQLPISIHH